MDFELIERHPWATAGIIGVGALLVYLYFRSRSSASASSTTYQGGYPVASTAAPDNQLAGLQIQANAQTNQLSTQLAAVGIQSNAQVQLGILAAQVQSQGIAATQ